MAVGSETRRTKISSLAVNILKFLNCGPYLRRERQLLPWQHCLPQIAYMN